MCLQCHLQFTDEEVLSQLRGALERASHSPSSPLNSTALSHLYLAAAGLNGPRCAALAWELLDHTDRERFRGCGPLSRFMASLRTQGRAPSVLYLKFVLRTLVAERARSRSCN